MCDVTYIAPTMACGIDERQTYVKTKLRPPHDLFKRPGSVQGGAVGSLPQTQQPALCQALSHLGAGLGISGDGAMAGAR